MAITLDAIEYPPGSGTYQSIGEATDYQGRFLASSPYEGLRGLPYESEVRGTVSALESISVGGRTIPIRLARAASGATSSQSFNANVMQWFDPNARDTAGETTRFLRVIWHDGSTQLRLPVTVLSVRPRAHAVDWYDIEVYATVPYLQALTEQSFTLTNRAHNGNARAPVRLDMTGTSLSVRRLTITDATGRGVMDYPVVLDAGTTTTQSQSFVFINGKSVPFAQGSNSRYFWVFVSVPPNGAITADIVYSTGVTNPLANTLDTGNLEVANTSNSQLRWDSVNVSQQPVRSGIWRQAVLRMASGGPDDWGYEMTAESDTSVRGGSSSVTFTLNTPASGQRNDANGMTCITGIEAGSTSDLSGISITTTNHTSGVRSFIRYRKAGSVRWIDADTWTTDVTDTGPWDVDDAVEFAIGIEYTAASPTDGATLQINPNTVIDLDLDTANDLNVSSSSTNYRLLDGQITNSTTGQTITFTNLIYAGSQLTLDTSLDVTEQELSPNGDGAVFGDIDFSHVDMMSLAPGSNFLSETLAGTVTVHYRDTYA